MENLKKLFTNAKGGYVPVPRKLSLAIGAKAAMFIAEICDKYEYYKENHLLNEYGEFYYTIPEMEKEIGLRKTEQSSIIKQLKEKGLFTTTTRTVTGTIKRVRYFKIDKRIDEKLINIMEASSKKAEEIAAENSKEVERCEELTGTTNYEVIKCDYGKVENMTMDSHKTLPSIVIKPTVNKNREKEQNIKTEQKEESLTLCLSDSINEKDNNTEYSKELLEKLSDKLSYTLGIEKTSIYNALEKANKDKGYSYKDLLLGYEFKEDAGTINHILENPEINTNGYKFNSIIKSIINGVPEALTKEKEIQAEYEEMNANNSQIIDFEAQRIVTEKAMQARENIIEENTIDFDVIEENTEEGKKEDIKIDTNSTSFMDFLDKAEKKQA